MPKTYVQAGRRMDPKIAQKAAEARYAGQRNPADPTYDELPMRAQASLLEALAAPVREYFEMWNKENPVKEIYTTAAELKDAPVGIRIWDSEGDEAQTTEKGGLIYLHRNALGEVDDASAIPNVLLFPFAPFYSTPRPVAAKDVL